MYLSLSSFANQAPLNLKRPVKTPEIVAISDNFIDVRKKDIELQYIDLPRVTEIKTIAVTE